jgi:hypothetical protein
MVAKMGRPLKTEGEVRPTDIAPVIAPNNNHAPTVYPMVWGFTNPREGGQPLVNCRVETAGFRPFWKESWQRRRCIIPCSYYRRSKIISGCGDGLYSRFFIAGNGMYHRFIYRNDYIAVFIELHAYLFIYQQDIMHFGLEVRISSFTVVLDFVRFDIRTMKYFLNHWFGYGFQARKPCFNSVCLNVLVQIFERP